jgi:hypothetical protein
VRPPFYVRPSPKTDTCGRGHSQHSAADIRASGGIPSDVDILILTGVRPPMIKGALELSPTADGLAALARTAGYTDAKLDEMDHCLK